MKSAIALMALFMAGCGGVRPSPPVSIFDAPGDVNVMLVWLSAISIVGIGGCIAAAVFLPIKRLAVAGIAGFAVVLGLALGVKAILPFLPWVMLALLVLGVAAVVWYFRKYSIGMESAVRFGLDMTNTTTNEGAEVVKDNHAIDQTRLGVKSLIDQTLKSLKANK